MDQGKRMLSFFLCVCLCVALLPALTLSASATESWFWPVDGVYAMTRGYYSDHNGLDIAASIGHVVRATKSGTVIESANSCPHSSAQCECNGGCGNYVKIKHTDGTYSRYLHLTQGTAIAVGTVVSQGDTVGKSGSSGRSNGPHLHFDCYNTSNVRINNNPTDPRHTYSGAHEGTGISYIYELGGSTTPSGPSTLSINPTVYPSGTIPAGQKFSLEGTVTSNYLITEFSGVVYNSAGGVALDEVTMYPNAYSVSIKNSSVDIGLKFATLAPNMTYILCYTAKDSSGKTVSWPEDWNGYWFWVGQVGEHTHDKGTYLFYEAAHPHCNCYRCSICGETWKDTSSSNEMSDCYYCQRPGKPALKNFATTYASGAVITFNWDPVSKATHYNLYIDKKKENGSWESDFTYWHYAESGMTTTLEEGVYRVLLQATNKNCSGEDGTGWAYTNADYITFFVGALPSISPSYINFDGFCRFFPQNAICVSSYNSTYFQTLGFRTTFDSGGSPLTQIKVYLQQLQSSFIFSVYKTIQSDVINLQGAIQYEYNNIDGKINIKDLEPGSYRICYQGTNSYGTSTVTQSFKVLPAPDPMPYLTVEPLMIEVDNVFQRSFTLTLYKNDFYGTKSIMHCIAYCGNNLCLIPSNYANYADYSVWKGAYSSSCEHTGANYAYIEGGWDSDCETLIVYDFTRIPYQCHTFESESIAASCTAEGCTKYTCKTCGKTVKQDIVEALGHSWDNGKITKEPTATENGVKTYTCSRCGKTKTEPIPKTSTFQFDDVKNPKAYYYDAVYWAYNHKPYQVTAGVDKTHFGPDQTVTRAQAMVFFWAAKDRPKFKKASTQFVDVKKSDWYYKAVMWAVEKGITVGTDATHFGPNQTCNRGQILTFLYAAVNKPKTTISNPYKDVSNQWYKKAALWAYEKRIERGENGKFNAATPCTRASTVTYLYRFLEGKSLVN